MRTSEAVLAAQMAGDREAEGAAIANYVRSTKSFLTNGSGDNSYMTRFFCKLAFGLSDCWYWCGCRDKSGYGRTAPLGGETFAHRVSWVMANGPIPMGLKVLHRCDVRNCVNPDHLFLGTQADNVADMIAKGRSNFPAPRYGERNPCSKLTVRDVTAIREEYEKCNTPMNKIASRYGVATMTIQRAIRGTTWSR